MRNVILADNQDISRVGLIHLLSKYLSITDFNEVAYKRELLPLLIENPESIIILDYTLFDFDSINDLIILQTRFPKSNWVVFSDDLNDEFVRNLLYNSNMVSVLMKDSSIDEIVTVIKEAFKGNRYIGNSVSNLLLDMSRFQSKIAVQDVLTSTEIEILKEMAIGKTTKEIAAHRHVSVHTVMTHRKNIFRKIDVNNVHEATKYAIRAGFVDMADYYI
jgi:two-component system, NarL family, response regulator LiaR